MSNIALNIGANPTSIIDLLSGSSAGSLSAAITTTDFAQLLSGAQETASPAGSVLSDGSAGTVGTDAATAGAGTAAALTTANSATIAVGAPASTASKAENTAPQNAPTLSDLIRNLPPLPSAKAKASPPTVSDPNADSAAATVDAPVPSTTTPETEVATPVTRGKGKSKGESASAQADDAQQGQAAATANAAAPSALPDATLAALAALQQQHVAQPGVEAVPTKAEARGRASAAAAITEVSDSAKPAAPTTAIAIDPAQQGAASGNAGGNGQTRDDGAGADFAGTALGNRDSARRSSAHSPAFASIAGDVNAAAIIGADARATIAATDVQAGVAASADVGTQLSNNVIDLGVGTQWIDRVAQDITNVAQGTGHASFQLNPPNLGHIKVDVWQGVDGGQVRILTETDEATNRLKAGKAGLEADARLSNLSLNSVVIERAAASAGGQNDQDTSGNNSQPDPRNHNQQAQNQTDFGGQSGGQTSSGGQANSGFSGDQNGNWGGRGKSSAPQAVLSDSVLQDAASDQTVDRSTGRRVRYA